MAKLPAALSIAGSDSGGAAGIQADLLTFAALGVYGTTAITCLTAQNPTGVSAIQAVSKDTLQAQIEQVLSYYPVRAIKTGMLFNEEIILSTATILKRHPSIQVVVDPVSVATSGAVLLQPEALSALKSELLPLATIITPNLDEAQLLLGHKIATKEEMIHAARELANSYHSIILVKGGHLMGDELADIAASPNGEITEFTQGRIQGIDTHGSGCTLSAAIAAILALGYAPLDSISKARDYLRRGMEKPLPLAKNHFINHFPSEVK